MAFLLLLLKVGIAAFVGIFLGLLAMRGFKAQALNKYARVKDSNYEKISSSAEKKFAYDAMEEKMYAQGIKYRMGVKFSPFDYTVLRLMAGIGIGLIGLLYKPWCFIPGFLLGIFIVPLYFKQENDNDNEEMLQDIGQMNSIVALQVKSGIHISKVIYECCRMINNPRLRQALLELSIDLENFATVQQAAVQFGKKFSNPHIDSFAKTLEQMESTGSSVEFFEDIVSSVARINEAINLREEKKAQRIGDFFQIMLFIGPLILVFYVLLGSFGGSGTSGLW